jgi:hypothetical protein
MDLQSDFSPRVLYHEIVGVCLCVCVHIFMFACVCMCDFATALLADVSDVTGHNLRLTIVPAINQSTSSLLAVSLCLSRDSEWFIPGV